MTHIVIRPTYTIDRLRMLGMKAANKQVCLDADDAQRLVAYIEQLEAVERGTPQD